MVLKANKKENAAKKEAPQEDTESNATEPKNSLNGSETESIDEVTALKESLAFEKDKTLRLAAEFENFKKRKQKEIDDFRKFANETIFRQLLSVVDNLERAILSAEEKGDEGGLLEGVKLTYKEILKLFESFNVRLIEAENQPFDHNFHQAVTQEENNDLPDNTVTTVLQKGYLLHDRLIRPAMVVVSKRTQKESEKTE